MQGLVRRDRLADLPGPRCRSAGLTDYAEDTHPGPDNYVWNVVEPLCLRLEWAEGDEAPDDLIDSKA